jgi:hypothetical protein
MQRDRLTICRSSCTSSRSRITLRLSCTLSCSRPRSTLTFFARPSRSSPPRSTASGAAGPAAPSARPVSRLPTAPSGGCCRAGASVSVRAECAARCSADAPSALCRGACPEALTDCRAAAASPAAAGRRCVPVPQSATAQSAERTCIASDAVSLAALAIERAHGPALPPPASHPRPTTLLPSVPPSAPPALRTSSTHAPVGHVHSAAQGDSRDHTSSRVW